MRQVRVVWLWVALSLALVGCALPRTAPQEFERHVSGQAMPGDALLVTITPSRLGGPYAVAENFGGLEFEQEHSADDYSADTFILLTPREFSYIVHIPQAAKVGQHFEITGQYWTDPRSKQSMPVTVMVVAAKADTWGAQMVVLLGLMAAVLAALLLVVVRRKRLWPPSSR